MTILCATDLSPHAQAAARAAAVLAKANAEKLTLMHVVDYIGAEAGLQDESVLAPQRVVVEQEARSLAAEFGIEVEPIVTPGFADETIVAVANDMGASLVVVGSLGRRRQHRWLLGSTAERVAQSSSRPVLVVRQAGLIEAWGKGERPLSVLVGVERATTSVPPLTAAAGLRSLGPCALTIAMIAWPQREHARLGVPGPMAFDALNPTVEAALMRDLRAFAETVPATHDVEGQPPTAFMIRQSWGRTDSGLVQLAGDLGSDIVVVGTHRRSAVASVWRGSVSRGVLHDSPGNVLCVPGAIVDVDAVVISRLRSVVVPTDFSPLADGAIAIAYGLVGDGGRVHLLHVVTPTTLENDNPEGELRARIPKATETIATTVEVVVTEDVAAAICAAAARVGADVICMGSHGRSGVSRLVLGSQAERVMRQAQRPVMVVPATTN